MLYNINVPQTEEKISIKKKRFLGKEKSFGTFIFRRVYKCLFVSVQVHACVYTCSKPIKRRLSRLAHLSTYVCCCWCGRCEL